MSRFSKTFDNDAGRLNRRRDESEPESSAMNVAFSGATRSNRSGHRVKDCRYAEHADLVVVVQFGIEGHRALV